MNEKRHGPVFGFGGITLLTVLLVLALTMFAVLTLSSAQADLRLTEKNSRAVCEYYAADTQAVRLQAQAAAIWPPNLPRPAALEMQNELSVYYDVRVSEQGSGLMIAGAIPVNEAGQILQVALFLAPQGNSDRWRVEQWQFMPPATEIREEPALPVWGSQPIIND